MWNIIFLVTGVMFITLLLIIIFSKEVINSRENKLFKTLAIINLIEYLMEIPLQLLVRRFGIDIALVDVFSKGYLVSLFTWYSFFSIYTFVICLNKKNNEKYAKNIENVKKINFVVWMIGAFLLVLLPFKKFYEVDKMYIYGTAVDIFGLFVVVYMITWIILLLFNYKQIKNKKYLPIFSVLLLGLINNIIQNQDPSVLIATMMGTFVCYIMYHTIENPDIKMLNEMAKNKELMEQGYEDKYNFLFEMTQEARGPLVNINNITNALRMEDDPKKVKDGLLVLNNMVRQLDFSINDILNISSLDVQKIKVVNNRYKLDELCKDLEVRVKPEVKDGVNFELGLPGQLPELYGDYMKIRQILYSLLVNACRNTESGSINMKVNVIEKYDACRVVFNISDTGSGMSIEKINEILSATGSLDKNEIENLEKKEFNVKLCQKVVKIMGGNLMIKSNIGAGTDVILTIDQRVYHEKDNSILTQYENAIANYRKVLIVSQNKNALGIIKKKLTDNHITYTSLYSGNDAIDRIKAGKKFDFVIVDDEMKEMSGFMTLEGMKKIKDFDSPVIIMLKEDKEHIKDHYLEDGFDDYILINNLENELNRIIEKY